MSVLREKLVYYGNRSAIETSVHVSWKIKSIYENGQKGVFFILEHWSNYSLYH